MGIWFLSLLINSGCNRDLVEYDSNDLKISIEKGEDWLHNFPLFLGINIKNPPQIAIWTEDMEGNYLSTVYVTHKIATQSWQASGGNRRKEALPHWCYQRGIQYEDGLYLPSKKEPLTDGISGATPKGSFNVKMSPTGKLKKFIVKIEINHSTDFNALKRIDDMADAVAASPARKIMIDHHLYPEDFCKIVMSYPKISSTSELIFRLICRMGYFSDISKEGAE